MSRVQVADRRLTGEGDGHCPGAVVAGRIVFQRPFMGDPGLEPAGLDPSGLRALDRGEPAGLVPARSPLARRVLDVGVEHAPAAEQAQGNGVRGPPLVDRAGIEEGDEQVELAALAEKRAGRGQVVVERLRRELASVVGRLGGRCDEAADLTGLAPGVGRSAVSEVLPDGPLLRDVGPVVAALPTRVLVEPLGSLLRHRPRRDQAD